MPRLRMRSIFFLTITFGLIGAFGYYLYVNIDKYLEILDFSINALSILVILTLLGMIINGFINTILFQTLGANLSNLDGFILASASTLANQLPISGGVLTRAYYLKQRHNLSYTKFFSVTVAIFVCFISVNGLIGIIILSYWFFIKDIQISLLLWGGFFIMLISALSFWLPIDKFYIPIKFRNWVSQAVDGWQFISKKPFVGLKLVGLQTTMMVLLAGRYWLAFHMFSQNVSIGDVLLFSSASLLTQLVSIAPGGLGVTETIVGAVASALGFDLGVSIVAVGLDRLISTLVILLVGGISMLNLSKQLLDNAELLKHGDIKQ